MKPAVWLLIGCGLSGPLSHAGLAAAIGPGWNTSHGSSAAARGFADTGRGGVTFGRVFGIGGEHAQWWTSLGSDVSANLLIIGTVHPDGRPLYLDLGVGGAEADLRSPSGERRHPHGFAFTLGGGLELPLLAPIALNADLDLIIQRFSASGSFPRTNRFVALLLGLAYRDRLGG